MLFRKCRCNQVGGPQFCAVCRVTKALQGVAPGMVLWQIKPLDFVKKLKCQLRVFGLEKCSAISPKSFRAGRATAMIKVGDPLGQVMLAGEWKSLSVLRYVNEEALDPYRVLDMQLDASDNEASDSDEEDDDKSDDG